MIFKDYYKRYNIPIVPINQQQIYIYDVKLQNILIFINSIQTIKNYFNNASFHKSQINQRMIRSIKQNGSNWNHLSNQVSFKNQQINQDYENEIQSEKIILQHNKIINTEKHFELGNKQIQSLAKQDEQNNSKYSMKRISVRHLATPSINKLQISNKQLSNNITNSKINSLHSSRSGQDEKKYMRRTCKMFHLDYRIDRPKTMKTMKNLVTNLQNNKFNQVQDKDNHYWGKKDKSFKVLKTSNKIIKCEKQIKQKQRPNENENNKIQMSINDSNKQNTCCLKVNFSAKCRNSGRKSRFSGRIGNLQQQQLQKLSGGKKEENKAFRSIKQSKFTEIKKLCTLSNFQSGKKNLPWMKWKRCHKNTQFNKTTQKMTTYLVNQNIEQQFRRLYEEQVKQKQQELRRFNMMKSGICKLKSNQKLIEGLRYQNKQRIQHFFDDLENKVLSFSEFANKHQCSSSQLEDLNKQLRMDMVMMELNTIKH